MNWRGLIPPTPISSYIYRYDSLSQWERIQHQLVLFVIAIGVTEISLSGLIWGSMIPLCWSPHCHSAAPHPNGPCCTTQPKCLQNVNQIVSLHCLKHYTKNHPNSLPESARVVCTPPTFRIPVSRQCLPCLLNSSHTDSLLLLNIPSFLFPQGNALAVSLI